MFADDTFGAKSDNDINVLINSDNEEINKIAIWFRANKLAVNISKTKYIIFKTRNKKLNANLPDVVFNANERGCPFNPELVTPLERIHNNHVNPDCRAYKLLGIFLDENLSLDTHINKLCKKLAKSLYCIKKAKNVINKSGLRSLYFALIHSHLSYCPIILNCSSKSNLKKLEKIQKKAIRIITNSRYNANANEIFITEKIYPLTKLLNRPNSFSCTRSLIIMPQSLLKTLLPVTLIDRMTIISGMPMILHCLTPDLNNLKRYLYIRCH
jgi:hypothetical protein